MDKILKGKVVTKYIDNAIFQYGKEKIVLLKNIDDMKLYVNYDIRGELKKEDGNNIYFLVEDFEYSKIENEKECIDFLTNKNIFEDINKRDAQKLVEIFGIDLMEKFSKDSKLLNKLKFLSIDAQKSIIGFVRDNYSVNEEKKYSKIEKNVQSYCEETGSTCILKKDFFDIFKYVKDIDLNKEKNLIIQDDFIFLKEYYDLEEEMALNLIQINKDKVYDYTAEIDNYIEKAKDCDDTQRKAIYDVINNPISIINGGPGSGKTYTLNIIIQIYKKIFKNKKIICTSLTGRASSLLKNVTGEKSFTIHSLIKKSEKSKMSCDLLIIDEFSLVDTVTFANLLRKFTHVKHLCIVGDSNQIPSIGPGNLLQDLINSNTIRLCLLKKIHRQKNENIIRRLCDEVLHEKLSFKEGLLQGVFIECDEREFYEKLELKMKELQRLNCDFSSIQIISPIKNSDFGSDKINRFIKDIVNPLTDEIDCFYDIKNVYSIDDKVMQIVNSYKNISIMNGEIGRVIEVKSKINSFSGQTYIKVEFDSKDEENNRVVTYYENNSYNNIDLAYCITIHKSQGNEYPIVIIPCFSQYENFIDKNMWYTAISRAKERVIIMGNKKIFEKTIKKANINKRMTGLESKLKIMMKCE